MSEEIKERLEKLRREYRPSMAGDVCLSWAADVAPALSEALALITSLTAELTAARGEVERLQRQHDRLRAASVYVVEAIALYPPSAGEDDDEEVPVRLANLKYLRAALTPAEEGERG